MKHALYLSLLAVFMAFSASAQYRCQDWKPLLHQTATPSIDYNPRSDTFNILHNDLYFDLRNQNSIIGRAKLDLVALQNAPSLRLELLNFFIDSVKLHGLPLLAYNRANPALWIIPQTAFQAGDTFQVEIFYRGNAAVDASGWGGWHVNPSYSFNLGVGFQANPHAFGRSLFPCFDNFVERSTFSTTICSAINKRAVSAGSLVFDTLNGNDRYTGWNLTSPIPSYLFPLALANYQKLTHTAQLQNGPKSVDIYALASDTANARASFKNLDSIALAFEHYFGAYVWQRIGYCLTTIGAMEHATSIHLPVNLVDGSLNGEDIIAHELAHHWFGNLLTCERAEDMWINEGWAEYLSHLYREFVYSPSDYLKTVRDNRNYVLRFAALRDQGHRALSEMPQDYTYGQTTYQKGAMVAHNLRAFMGDSLFFYALKQIFANHAFQNAGINRFQQLLEQYSSLNLQNFFDGWVNQPGYPNFSIDSLHHGNATVFLEIKQSGKGNLQPWRNQPLFIHFFDLNGQEEIHQVKSSASGSDTTYLIVSQFPQLAFAVIDLNGRHLTAHSPERKTVTQNGILEFKEADIRFEATAVNAPFQILAEHNWVAASGQTSPTILKMSKNHFWRIQGTWSVNDVLKANIIFDGRSNSGGLDGDLLAFGEDSLMLIYRPHPKAVWQEYPYYVKDMQGSNLNKTGIMRLNKLLQGDYAFANGTSTLGTNENTSKPKDSLLIYPNPTQSSLYIELPKRMKFKNGEGLKLYDAQGRSLPILEYDYDKKAHRLHINTSKMGKGSYWIEVQEMSGRFEKQ